MYKGPSLFGTSSTSKSLIRLLCSCKHSLGLCVALCSLKPAEMDAFFTIASPIPSEQPEMPQDEESGGTRSNTSSCVIA